MMIVDVFIVALLSVLDMVFSYDMQLVMPGVTTEIDDAYLCSAFPLPNPEKHSYIKSYESTSNSSIAHHILLYGCLKPFSSKSFYPCSQICENSNEKILFAWAKDAKKFNYPEDTGMAVGGDTEIMYLVLQVHYLKKMDTKDHSGMKVKLTYDRPTHLVSIALLFSYYGDIPANTGHVNMDISCKYIGKVPAYPLAFRTHAHMLGRTISGFRVSHTDGQIDLIGKGNPQWPQTFYKANSTIWIMPGDILMARCVFDSTGKDQVTSIGSTHHDEMCNFYIMLVSKNSDSDIGFNSCGGNEYVNLWKNIPRYSQEYSESVPSSDLFLENKRMSKLTFESQWKVQASLGEVSSVAILPQSTAPSNYSLIVLHRADRYWNDHTFKDNIYIGDKTPISSEVILEVDHVTGKVLRKAGANIFIMPHGLTVTKDGKYLWVTDVALHQVMRFTLLKGEYGKLINEKPDMVFGERFVLGNDKQHFCKPTKVAVDSKGFIFVADGYCNSRIVCLYPNGTYFDEWRTKEMMMIVHSITIDEDRFGDSRNSIVWVADRNNQRIVAFKYDGTVVFTSSATKNGMQIYAIEFNSLNRLLYGVTANEYNEGSSFVFDYKTNTFLGSWHSNYELKAPHDMCLVEDGNTIFVAELHLKTVIKFSLVRHSVRYLTNSVEFVPQPRQSLWKLKPVVIVVILFLIIFVVMLCILLFCLFGRYSKQENKLKRYYPKSKDREGFEPLTQHDDNQGDSDPETEEFSAPNSKVVKKPKV